MKIAYKLLLGLVLFQGAAFAADEPKIEVVDGKISMSAQAVSLERLLSLFDRAMGTKSEIKNGLGNRNISVQFTNLSFGDAVRKIFQGQPLNYMAVPGKGIRVLEVAGGGPDTGSSISSSPSSAFSTSSFNSPVQPIQNGPVQSAPPSIFGSPAPAPAPANNPSAPMTGPGAIPPPIGASNPLINPTGGNSTGVANPGPAMPQQQPAQPAGPGVIPGAAPGTIK